MKNNGSCSILSVLMCAVLVGCADDRYERNGFDAYSTPTVDYVEFVDVKDSDKMDSFLNHLAVNYRSYAVYNARTSGYPEIGELFAQKAVTAFSGETPYPESLDNWEINNDSQRFEIYTAYNDLMNELKNDAASNQPELAAEAQAKFDCWLSAAASGQMATAEECRARFSKALRTLRECDNGKVVEPTHVKSENVAPQKQKPVDVYYPETRRLSSMAESARARDGIIIVNNVNVPSPAIQPMPVPQQPMVINQNLYGTSEENTDCGDDGTECPVKDCPCAALVSEDATGATDCSCNNNDIPKLSDEYVSRDEFINMMMAMRAELMEINKRLDAMNVGQPAQQNDKTIIKVQQIPLEPQQRIMEEIFEIHFDFDKAMIKPEYDDIIKKLAATTQANKNVKVSVVGHTDTAGSSSYNYALGGRRAEAVQKMLIDYGIPSAQIVAVSAGEEDLKVKTPNNTPNAENRRVRVVKETQYTEPVKPAPIVVEEYSEIDDCEEEQ